MHQKRIEKAVSIRCEHKKYPPWILGTSSFLTVRNRQEKVMRFFGGIRMMSVRVLCLCGSRLVNLGGFGQVED